MLYFITQLSCSFPAAMAASPAPLPSATCDKGVSADVIIVGAGMAGLTAARQLEAAGVSYVVVEAQNRIGGRAIVQEAGLEMPIDLGGAWVHGVETNPLTPYVRASGRVLVPTDVSGTHHLYLNHRYARPRELAAFSCILEHFEENLSASAHPDNGVADPSLVNEYLDSSAAREHVPGPEVCREELDELTDGDADYAQLRALAELNVGPLESAVELSANSTRDAADFEAGNDALILGGYGNFVESYGKTALPHTCLNTKVVKVQTSGSGVTVTAEKGAVFKGKKVLVTVSTGVLLKGGITFDPPLPDDKQNALKQLPMGVLNKVILQFQAGTVPGEPHKLPLQTDEGVSMDDRWVLYGGDPADPKDDLAFVFFPGKTNIVIAFAGGDRARAWEQEDNRPFVEATFKALDAMCGCNARTYLQGTPVTTHWASSPISFGAYSAANPSGTDWRAILAAPVDNRLYFAGEATYNSEYNGSYAAAYNSAIVAAGAMVEDFCGRGGAIGLKQNLCLGTWKAK